MTKVQREAYVCDRGGGVVERRLEDASDFLGEVYDAALDEPHDRRLWRLARNLPVADATEDEEREAESLASACRAMDTLIDAIACTRDRIWAERAREALGVEMEQWEGAWDQLFGMVKRVEEIAGEADSDQLPMPR